MRLDRLDADVEALGDLAVHPARDHQLEDLALAPGELGEARTVGGVLIRRLGPEYLVPIAPTNGQSKGFLITEVAPLFRQQPSCGLYVGDYDLSGNAIEDNTRRVLERFAEVEILWERVAITEAAAPFPPVASRTARPTLSR